jgi:transcription antitermination factor NusG
MGGEPAPVETSEIEAVRLAVNSPLSVEPHASLVRGQRITVRGGPLKGLAGTLLDVRKTIRLAISVELLCRSVVVEIERDWVAPYEPAGLSTRDWHAAGLNIVERMHPR